MSIYTPAKGRSRGSDRDLALEAFRQIYPECRLPGPRDFERFEILDAGAPRLTIRP